MCEHEWSRHASKQRPAISCMARIVVRLRKKRPSPQSQHRIVQYSILDERDNAIFPRVRLFISRHAPHHTRPPNMESFECTENVFRQRPMSQSQSMQNRTDGGLTHDANTKTSFCGCTTTMNCICVECKEHFTYSIALATIIRVSVCVCE